MAVTNNDFINQKNPSIDEQISQLTDWKTPSPDFNAVLDAITCAQEHAEPNSYNALQLAYQKAKTQYLMGDLEKARNQIKTAQKKLTESNVNKNYDQNTWKCLILRFLVIELALDTLAGKRKAVYQTVSLIKQSLWSFFSNGFLIKNLMAPGGEAMLALAKHYWQETTDTTATGNVSGHLLGEKRGSKGNKQNNAQGVEKNTLFQILSSGGQGLFYGLTGLGVSMLALPSQKQSDWVKVGVSFFLLKITHWLGLINQARNVAFFLYQEFPGFTPGLVAFGDLYQQDEPDLKFNPSDSTEIGNNVNTFDSEIITKVVENTPLQHELICLSSMINTSSFLKAVFYWEKAREKSPVCLTALSRLANFYAENSQITSALFYNHQRLNLQPFDMDTALSLGTGYEQIGEPVNAIAYYEMALNLSQDNQQKAVIATLISGIYESELKDLSSAIAYCKIADSLNSGNIEVILQLGTLYFHAGQLDCANIVYQNALNHGLSSAQLFSNLGYLSWISQDMISAIEYYNQAIELAPDYKIPFNNLGVIYLDELLDTEKALEMFGKAHAIDEEYALALYNLGRTYSLLGKTNEAVACYHKAKSFDPESHEVDATEVESRIQMLLSNKRLENNSATGTLADDVIE
ncbi:MAG: tetratricopeptide repeat protein [Cyanobacteria bacterium P01_H01_bin.74]